MNYLQFLLFLLCFSFLTSSVTIAQSPYEFNTKRESSYLALGGAALGYGYYLRSKSPLFTTDELITLDPKDINAFDRLATGYFSKNANKASDIFWTGSHALPLLFLIGKKSRKNFSAVASLYGEVILINTGLTLLSKHAFKRPRPFVFNEGVENKRKLVRTAKASFVSGHTSMTAANCFFAAKVYSDYYPESGWKPAIWTTAAIIPAITGYLRVRAGKHYPTDTIAGYILGATTGFLIPHLHKKKMENVSFYGGPGGMLVQVHF